MKGLTVDGNDVEAVLASAFQAIATIRSTGKPLANFHRNGRRFSRHAAEIEKTNRPSAIPERTTRAGRGSAQTSADKMSELDFSGN